MAHDAFGCEQEPLPWHLGVFDAHCHPTDTVSTIDEIAAMKTRVLTIMATRSQDQSIVADFASRLGISIASLPMLVSPQFNKTQGHLLPCFGWHPWFSHQVYDDISCEQPQAVNKSEHYTKVITPSPNNDHDFINSLPDPRPLSSLIDQIRNHLQQFPLAMVGEIGLDRSFRIPGLEMVDEEYVRDPALTSGGREGRRLSPYRVNMDHQKMILKAQLHLAGEMHRAISVHGVAAHGIVFESLKETWRGHEKHMPSKRERKRKVGIGAEQESQDSPRERTAIPGEPKPFPPVGTLHLLTFSAHSYGKTAA